MQSTQQCTDETPLQKGGATPFGNFFMNEKRISAWNSWKGLEIDFHIELGYSKQNRDFWQIS